MYRNICTDYCGLKVRGTEWKAQPKVVENDQTKIPWNFQIQTVMANQPDIVVVDKQQKASGGRCSNPKLEKYQGLKEELQTMWRVKTTVVPVGKGALWAVTPKLDEWLQQTPGTTYEVSVHKSTKVKLP